MDLVGTLPDIKTVEFKYPISWAESSSCSCTPWIYGAYEDGTVPTERESKTLHCHDPHSQTLWEEK